MHDDDKELREFGSDPTYINSERAQIKAREAKRGREREWILRELGEPFDYYDAIYSLAARPLLEQVFSAANYNRWWDAFGDVRAVCGNPHLTDDERLMLTTAIADIMACLFGYEPPPDDEIEPAPIEPNEPEEQLVS